jgi:hypothetical protein
MEALIGGGLKGRTMCAKSLRSLAPFALIVALSATGCMMPRAYDQAQGERLVAAKGEVILSSRDERIEAEDKTVLFKTLFAVKRPAYAVRYMGLDAGGDPVIQVLSPSRGRTEVPLKLAQSDRVDLAGFGVPPVTVVVVEASDDVLAYRLEGERREFTPAAKYTGTTALVVSSMLVDFGANLTPTILDNLLVDFAKGPIYLP